MRYVHVNLKVPAQMATALAALAKAKFEGNRSDAVRFLLTNALLSGENPKFRAAVAAYANLFPKMQARMMAMINEMDEVWHRNARQMDWK